jgi:hypothetical protein
MYKIVDIDEIVDLISTQPGSTPLASFKVVSLDEVETQASNDTGNNFGNMYFQKVKCQDMPNVLEHYETCFVFLK